MGFRCTRTDSCRGTKDPAYQQPPTEQGPQEDPAEQGPVPQVQECNASTQSGGAGVTNTRHLLGAAGPTNFLLEYDTLNVPDKIDVFYEGREISTTGYVGDNLNDSARRGVGSIRVDVPAGRDTAVLVRVTGPNGTEWSYKVNCPA